MQKEKILQADMLDIVFYGRNKDYGAYDLRRGYDRRMGKALMVTGAVVALGKVKSYKRQPVGFKMIEE